LPSSLDVRQDQHKVVLIDNASTDNSINTALSIKQDLSVIKIEQNLGFAGGYTHAMSQVDSKYVAIINSDVQVTSDWLAPLIEELESDSSIGAVQPKILSDQDQTKFEYAGAAGGYMDLLAYPFCRGRILDHIESDKGQYDADVSVAWTSGAAMVTRTELFRQAGGFDPDFFAHMEEIDYCWRLRNAGFQLKCIPSSTVYHLGGGTLNYHSPRKAFLNLRNNYWMILKNESVSALIWKIPVRLVIDTAYALKTIISGRPTEAISILKGIMTGLSKMISVSRKRKNIKYFINRNKINTPLQSGKLKGALVLKLLSGKKTFDQLKDLINS